MRYDWNALRKVLAGLALAMLLSATLATGISGFSSETLRTFADIFQKMAWVMFWVAVLLGGIFLYHGLKEQKALNASRKRCHDAHRKLAEYLKDNSLKGYGDAGCQRFQKNLERELERHCRKYPADLEHQTIIGYRSYNRQVKELEEKW